MDVRLDHLLRNLDDTPGLPADWKHRLPRRLTKEEEVDLRHSENYSALLASIDGLIRCRLRGVRQFHFVDAYQSVWLWLLRSAHNFDPSKGKITTWAEPGIRRALSDWRMECSISSLVRVPKYHKSGSKNPIEAAIKFAKYAEAHCTEAADLTLFSVPEKDAGHADEMVRLEELSEWRATLEWFLRPDNGILTSGERQVLSMRRSLTLAAVGDSMGISKQRVLQIQNLAVRKIAAHLQLDMAV